VKTAVQYVHAEHCGRGCLAFAVQPECLFHGDDAVVDGQKGRNLSRSQQQDLFRFHASAPVGSIADKSA